MLYPLSYECLGAIGLTLTQATERTARMYRGFREAAMTAVLIARAPAIVSARQSLLATRSRVKHNGILATRENSTPSWTLNSNAILRRHEWLQL